MATNGYGAMEASPKGGVLHKLLLSQQASAQEMTAERFESLRGEVRSFMQGQAAGRRSARPSA
jgi:hypothetical protein